MSLAKSQSLLTYNFASNPNYYAQAPDSLPFHTLGVHLIDKEQIAFIGELGEGCFGKVYKGGEISWNLRNCLFSKGRGCLVRVYFPLACFFTKQIMNWKLRLLYLSGWLDMNLMPRYMLLCSEENSMPYV